VACCKISGRERAHFHARFEDDTSLCTRSSARHETLDCCPRPGTGLLALLALHSCEPKATAGPWANAGWSDGRNLGCSLSEPSASEQRCAVLVAWRRLNILAAGT
jgi:hypothetical protein